MWKNPKAEEIFRKGLIHRISEGYLCGLCLFFSRYSDWGYCHNFMSKWRDQYLHEEFSCENFELSTEFVSYKRKHPGECHGGCKI